MKGCNVHRINEIVRRINDDPKVRFKVRELAAKAGDPLTLQAIHEWKNLRDGVPPKRVAIVAKALKIPKHEVRPDIFPPPKRKNGGSDTICRRSSA